MNRLKKDLPKIGIRMIIDARRNGVREKIEEPLKKTSLLVKELIESSLRHSSGEPVECVISHTAVGGAAEAASVSQQFIREGVGACISVTRAWAYAAEVIEMDPTMPQAIYGFNGSQRPGAVYLAGAAATSDQKGLPVFKIYGRDIQDNDDYSIPQDIKNMILRFTRCALAVASMRGTSYLSIGGASMGIGGSIMNPDLLQTYFGMRAQQVDMSELIRRIELRIYDEDEYQKAMKWVNTWCKPQESEDPNEPSLQKNRIEKDKDWEICVKMTLIIRDLMCGNPKLCGIGWEEEAEGHNAFAAGFQGQRQWTDHFPNGDFMEAILNSSFDWNGIRQPYIVATENDSLNALTMLMGHLLSGTAQVFADVRAYWSPDALRRIGGPSLPKQAEQGFIYLTNSGAAALDGTGSMRIDGAPAMKHFKDISPSETEACLRATKWGAAKLASFRGGGFSSSFFTEAGMPITVARLNYVKGLGPVLQIAEGESIGLPDSMQNAIITRTDPTWPKTFFVPRLTATSTFFRDVYSVMFNWGSNHCAYSYGHIGADWVALASMLRIPIAMHNLPESSFWRPSAWTMFGEGAASDILACKNFGPLYK